MSATSIILCLIALILLQCRTAFIGTAVCIILILNHQYQLLHKLQNKFSKPILIIIVATTLCLTAIAFTLLYHSKQASSDGRLFIWKISLQAIAQKPILGSGYGQFEHDYNLAQAKYFATGTATQQEIRNASYVHMSYNEFLENLFEGGIIGLVLFVGLIAALLAPCPLKGVPGSITAKEGLQKVVFGSPSKMRHPTENIGSPHKSPFRVGVQNTLLGDGGVFFAYAGIATFTIMCFFNFTIQAIPVRALFILYAAVCCTPILERTQQKKVSAPITLHNTPLGDGGFAYSLFGVWGSFGVLIFSLFLFFKFITLSNSYNRCQYLLETADENKSYNEAIEEMDLLKVDMKQSTHYWWSYGRLLYKSKNYPAAVEKLNMATNLTSNPDLYLKIGNCYEKMSHYAEAAKAFSVAENIEPHLFKPRYESMRLFAMANDTSNTVLKAKEIIDMVPKVPSDKVNFYKKEAQTTLLFATFKK